MPPIESTAPDEVSVSRRSMIRTVGVGAVVLAATHLGVAYEATQWAQQAPEAKNAELQAELERLRGLVTLYENLEKVGVDALIAAGMGAVRGLLDGARSGLAALSSGVSAVEGLLAGFAKSFAALRTGLLLVEGLVTRLAGLISDTEKFVGAATSPIKPLALQLQQFFSDLLAKIPFSIGDNIRKAIDAQVAVLTELPNFVLGLNKNLIEPLRTTWFSDKAAQNLQGTLLDPVTRNVLEPAKKQLTDFDQILLRWEGDFRAPVQNALDQRQALRQQIAEYKKQHGIKA